MADQEVVSIKKYVGMFAAVYILTMIGTGILVNAFFAESNIVVNSLFCIFMSAESVTNSFAQRYHRTFNSIEYRNILMSSIIIDVTCQSVSQLFIHDLNVSDTSSFGLIAICIPINALMLAFLYSSRVVKKYTKYIL